MLARLCGICSQFEGYKPGQNRCRIELANDAFDIAKTSRQRVHGNDIPVTGRCQGGKAQIEKCAGECRVVLKRDPLECIWNRQADKREQRCEGHRNQQVQKDRSDDSVIGDATSPEHRPSDHNSESDRDDKPCGGQQVQVVWPRIKQPEEKDDKIGNNAIDINANANGLPEMISAPPIIASNPAISNA